MNNSFKDFIETMDTARAEEIRGKILARAAQTPRPAKRAVPKRWMYIASGAAAAACVVLVVVALLPRQEDPGPLFPVETPVPTQSPVPSDGVMSPVPTASEEAEPTPTPEPRQDMELLDAYKLRWEYTSYEKYRNDQGLDYNGLKKLRDEVYAGRAFSELLPNEQYNVKLLDFLINDFKDNQYSCAIGPAEPKVPNYKEYPADKEIEIDLNGDGVPERIQVVSVWDDEEGPISRLLVNDVEYDYFTSWGDWIPVDEFYIVNIDTADSYLEIAIRESNAVSLLDYTRYYYYDGEKVVYMGSVQAPYLYRGDGTVIGTDDCRLGLLYTYLPFKYKLDKNHMLTLVPEIYKLDYKVFVLRDLPLYTSRDTKSATILMEKGTTVRITGRDGYDEGWTQLTLANGTIGWTNIGYDCEDVLFCIRNEG